MAWFLGLGIAGVVLLVLSLVLDGVLEGLFDGVDALDGLFDGWLSLPVIAGFVSMLGSPHGRRPVEADWGGVSATEG